MRNRSAGGLDLGTSALIACGAVLIVAALVAAVIVLNPTRAVSGSSGDAPAAIFESAGRTSLGVPSDRVATVLNLDVTAGAGGAARAGDHVEVLGYFSHQVTGGDNLTRVLMSDVAVVAVDRSASNVALTLAVPQDAAMLMQEAQALGVRPFVVLLPAASAQAAADTPPRFSDADLATLVTVAR